jgi:hypothetical protein
LVQTRDDSRGFPAAELYAVFAQPMSLAYY